MKGVRPERDAAHAQNKEERLIVIAVGAPPPATLARSAFLHVELLSAAGCVEATELAVSAVGRCDILAAYGADEACAAVLQGLFDGADARNRRTIFTVLPTVRGEFARNLEMPADTRRALWVAATGITLPADVGLVSWGGNTRVFLNGLVVGSARARPTPRSWRWEGPDGTHARVIETAVAHVANGAHVGGQFIGAPASMFDGHLDVSIRGAVVMSDLIASRLRARMSRVWMVHGEASELVDNMLIPEGIDITCDGTRICSSGADARVLPHAVQVRGGWLRPPAGPA